MKSYSICLLAIIALSCSQSQTTSETSSNDSLAVQPVSNVSTPGSVASSTTPVQQVRNFPDYSYETVLSEDEFESTLTTEVDELISAHDNLSLLTYSMYSKRSREYEGDYGEVSESIEETETWFFDRNYKLRAYSKKYYRDGEGRDTRVLVRIYTGDTLAAVSEYRIDDGQIGFTYHTKMLASKCPKCGIGTEAEAGSTGKVTGTVSREDMDSHRGEDSDVYNLVDNQLWKDAQREGDDYVAKEHFEQWTDGVNSYQNPYDIDYTMSKDLYTYLQFRNFIYTFDTPNAQFSEDVAKLFLDVGTEMASYSVVEMLENETVYFLLYKKFRQVGQGIEELYALTYTKDGEYGNNVLVGSSYAATGPDETGEEYEYEYDSEKRVLNVTKITVSIDAQGNESRKEEVVPYKLLKDGTIDGPSRAF